MANIYKWNNPELKAKAKKVDIAAWILVLALPVIALLADKVPVFVLAVDVLALIAMAWWSMSIKAKDKREREARQ